MEESKLEETKMEESKTEESKTKESKTKEEKKYKFKKYGKILFPLLLVGIILIVQVVKIRWNGVPSTIEVSDQNIQEVLKEALAQDKMLTIQGKTDRIAYNWFYDAGTIKSIYDTNLTLYESGQWEQKVSDRLKASSVFAYQYSKDIQLNGFPVLTIKLLHQNTEEIALYQLEDGKITFVMNPIVNLVDDGAEITFPVYETQGIYCLVSDSQNKVAVASLYGEDNSEEEQQLLAANEVNLQPSQEFLQGIQHNEYQEEEVNQGQEVNPKQEVDEQNREGHSNQLANAQGNVVNSKLENQKQTTNQSQPTKQEQTVNSDSDTSVSEMDRLVQNTDKNSLTTVEIPNGQALGKENSKQDNTNFSSTNPSSTNQKKTNDNSYTSKPSKDDKIIISEDKKPTGQQSSIGSTTTTSSSSTSSSENRVISDGKQTEKDQYETDPVPAGKPLPVEPENQVVNYKKAYSCTLSIDCLTIQDNRKDLDPTKKEYVPEDGYILKSKKVIFYEGESVFDVLLRETQKAGIQMEYSMTPMYNSNYIEGINNLYEFDCGNLSGWMYSVDGWYPNYGCSRYILCDGEVVKWRYTCDLGRDVGCDWLDGTK